MNIKFLVKPGKSGSRFREMLVSVYEDNVMKKNGSLQVGDTFF
jgi:hypothetical protein